MEVMDLMVNETFLSTTKICNFKTMIYGHPVSQYKMILHQGHSPTSLGIDWLK